MSVSTAPINLLPPDIKQGYHYARHNTRLVNWVVVFTFALVGLAAISLGGVWYLNQAAKPYYRQVADTQTNLKKQDQAGTEKQVKDITNNLKLAVQVLSKEVLFSKLLKQLAVIIPVNVTLSNLDISQTTGALDITANTTDYNAATQLQVNLADPANKLFIKADIVNINCSGANNTSGNAKYPCTVTLRALFAANNPFLFISNTATAPTAKAKP